MNTTSRQPDFAALERQYRTALMDDIIPFWEKHSIDTREGGYFTCLNRDGTVYDTDKFIWLQCRQAWLFSMLYIQVEARPRWLEIARHGIEFLKTHGMDPEGYWYFALTRNGSPLVQPYSIFSDCFAAMAFAAFSRASGDGEAATIALRTYRNVLARRENPKGRFGKSVPGTRPLRPFSIPMILLNLSMEMESLLSPAEFRSITGESVSDITEHFLDRTRGFAREFTAPDGTPIDCHEGRLVNPGHTIEGTWFLLDAAKRSGDRALVDTAVDSLIRTLQFGWDAQEGGIFYFLDADGKPPQQLEWDQKLWWVHCEALVALAMAYQATRRSDTLEWFVKVHDYTWNRFPDPAYGEWFGYLNRRGEVLLPLKGGKWKGCFHIPRALHRCARIFGELAAPGAS